MYSIENKVIVIQDSSGTENEHPFLKHLKEIVIANFSNEQFGVETLASACRMNRTNLYRKVKRLTGGSVSKLIKQVRLEEAYNLLKTREHSVAEVAHIVGFGSTSYFTTSFKAHFGFSPSDTRKILGYGLEKSSSKKEIRISRIPRLGILIVSFILLIGTIAVISSTSEPREIKERSIAVIRFDDMSMNQSLQNFADGLGEEIINSLCKIKTLKVTARNSSFLFNKTSDHLEIKDALEVNYFIEGSVRQNVNNYRVTVQLVDATTGYHLWSQNFDRPKKDILAFQEEISRFVAKKLRVELTKEEDLALSSRLTKDSLAFRYYSDAIRLHHSNNAEDVREGIERMKQAIAIDSNFAEAHARIVEFYSWSSYIGETRTENAQKLMQYHVDKALFLGPNMAETYLAKGQLEVLNKDYKAALDSYSRAIELEPNNNRGYGLLSYVLRYFRREKEAYDCWFKARSLDPLKVNLTLSIGQYYYYIKKDFDKGISTLRNILEIIPNKGFSGPHLEVFRASLPTGDAATAIINFYESYKYNPNGARETYWLTEGSTWLDLKPLNDMLVDKMHTMEPNRLTTRWCLTANNALNGKHQDNANLTRKWYQEGVLNSREYIDYLAKSYLRLGKAQEIKELISDSIPEIFEPNYLDNAENFDPYLVNKLDFLEHYIMALRELGEIEEANHFANLVIVYLDEEMQRLRKDDILDYRREISYQLIQASVNDDVESCIKVLQRAVFEDNHLMDMNDRIKVSTRLYRIRKDPRFKKFVARFDEKIASQRQTVIDYLKEEGVWRSEWGN